MDYADLDGVLLTHAHRDHINACVVRQLVKNRVPLYCHSAVVEHLDTMFPSIHEALAADLIRPFGAGSLRVGALEAEPFMVPHDAPGGTWGYALSIPQGKEALRVVVSTDLGRADTHLIDHFRNSDVIVLESNHNRQMLRDSGRPIWLQQRIRRAHLCNTECASFLAATVEKSERPIHTVVLAHVSQQCNTNDLALEHARRYLDGSGVNIVLTHKQRASEVVTL